jgi:CMP/dCMP kinase
MARRIPVMTIDGPSGSGKGTVSRAAARALGWALLDSGALYRLVALAGRQAALSLDDEAGLARMAETAEIRFGAGDSGEEAVWLGAFEVTDAIRTEEAGNDASKVAALPKVPAALL